MTAVEWLDELDAARAKATPGPWMADSHELYVNLGGALNGIPGDWIGETCRVAGDPLAETSDADAALIVAAVNALPKLTYALRLVLDRHQPVEWQECNEDGVPDLDKPLASFCHECTDDEYVNAVEFGDTIDQGSPVVDWPCRTVQAIAAALAAAP